MARIRGKKTQGGRHGPDSEYTIQKSICELLDWKAPWLLYCASAGGVRTSSGGSQRMKLTGYKKGFPDLFSMSQGRASMGLQSSSRGTKDGPHRSRKSGGSSSLRGATGV